MRGRYHYKYNRTQTTSIHTSFKRSIDLFFEFNCNFDFSLKAPNNLGFRTKISITW